MSTETDPTDFPISKEAADFIESARILAEPYDETIEALRLRVAALEAERDALITAVVKFEDHLPVPSVGRIGAPDSYDRGYSEACDDLHKAFAPVAALLPLGTPSTELGSTMIVQGRTLAEAMGLTPEQIAEGEAKLAAEFALIRESERRAAMQPNHLIGAAGTDTTADQDSSCRDA